MQRGLKNRRPAPQRLAVLVLDVMTDFTFDDGPAICRALTSKCDRILNLLRRARRNDVPVIYANDDTGHWRSDAPSIARKFVAALPDSARCLTDLVPEPADYVVLKPRHSAFYATPLEVLLQHLRIGSLLLAGISTESCVWMTACDAYIRGYRLIVPGDVVAGVSRRAEAATFTGLRRVLGVSVPARADRVPMRRPGRR